MMIDKYGRLPLRSELMTEIAGMHQPVSCNRCSNGVYDLGTVEVIARYTDCSMWRTPCCGSVVDDRGESGWKCFNDYTRIDRSGADT